MTIKTTMTLIYVLKISFVKNIYILHHVIILTVNIFMIFLKLFHVEIFNSLVTVQKVTHVIIYMLTIIIVINKNKYL